MTNKLKTGVPEQVIMQMHWGNLNTRMMATYCHLDNQFTYDAMLQNHGIEKKEKRQYRRLKITDCPRCHTSNAPSFAFCAHCGLALTEEAILSVDSATAAIHQALASGGERDLVDAITRRVIEEMGAKVKSP